MILKGKMTFTILSVVSISATLFSLLYYQFHVKVSEEIVDLAYENIRSYVEIQAHDYVKILNENIDSIIDNLEIISNTEIIEKEEFKAPELIQIVQNTSDDLVDYYRWINEEGKIVWSSDNTVNFTTTTPVSFNQDIEKSLIENSKYFSIPKETWKPYIDNNIDPIDNTLKWYISYPIIVEKENNNNKTDSSIIGDSNFYTSLNDKEFKGILTAVIEADTLGKFLHKQIPLKYDTSIDIFKRDGTVLYSEKESIIGKNIFSSDFQKIYPIHTGDSYNLFNNRSLNELKSGIFDLSEGQNKIISIAYQPILFDSKQIKQNHKDQFGTLYVNAPNHLANDVLYMLEQQRIFSILVYITIILIAAGISLTIITWNKRLKHIVNLRTSQLIQSNKKLQLANEKLKMNDKMQKEFINIAAHELRTPTQSIMGYIEMLELYPANIKNYIISLKSNSERLYRLIQDILDITKIESGNLALQKTNFDLNQVINNVIRDLSTRKNEKEKNQGIKFIFQLKDTIRLFADKERIYQVVSNLIKNAIKFASEDSKIEIFLEKIKDEKKEKESVSVKVRDNGKGIDSEILPRLFSKFTTKSEYGGTGLGLYIAKNIVESHRGIIRGYNNPDGEKGATFEFILPLYKE
jgi:signal transduction histidine kinase